MDELTHGNFMSLIGVNVVYLVCCEGVLYKKVLGCLLPEVSILSNPGVKVISFLWYYVVWFNLGVCRYYPWSLGRVIFVWKGCRYCWWLFVTSWNLCRFKS